MTDVCRVCGARATHGRCTLCGSTKTALVAPEATRPFVPPPPAVVPAPASSTEALADGQRSGRPSPGVLAAVITGVALIGIVGWVASAMIQPPTAVSAKPAALTASASASAPARPAETTPSPAAVPVSSTAPPAQTPATGVAAARTETYPEVRVAAGQECARTGTGPFAAAGTSNATTSCPFAINVRNAYVEQLNGQPGQIRAYSPTTKLWYDMECGGAQPVLCTGGKAGRVIIYGGKLRVG